MSKTKEEILQHHYIHDRGLVNPVLYVHNAMDAWADQKLEEYKERLKEKLKDEIVIGQTLVFKKIDEL